MGNVYLARDLPLYGRPVVIKFLLEALQRDPYVVKKFNQEVEALSRIDHHGVVTLLGAGKLADGQLYLVMQYVEGVTLRSQITPDGIDFERAASILGQVGDALEAVHANAARAMLRSGDTSLLVSEYRDAFERYRRAFFLAGKTDDQLIKVRILSHTASLQSYLGKNDVADETLRKALALLERDSSLSDTIANVHEGRNSD